MKTYCNPVDLVYRFARKDRPGMFEPCREGADPAAIFWHGKYWCVSSKAAGVHWSDDLVEWHCVRDEVLPHDGYAPDLFVRGGKLYFDTGAQVTTVFEAVDPEHGIWKSVGKEIQYADPAIFPDDDGRVYCYQNCSNRRPIEGAELDPETFQPLGEWRDLVGIDPERRGWERGGENNSGSRGIIADVFAARFPSEADSPAPTWNEGAFLIRHDGRYYLQNSVPGTEHNVYADAVSISNSPLGPFEPQKDNPFSLKPGGFITGAGHSSSFRDRFGNLFHISTMRITKRLLFERRIGLFPAGFLPDGTLYCRQRFGDWPHFIPDRPVSCEDDLFTGWMLQSYRARISATSSEPGFPPENAVDENIRTDWAAAENDPRPALTLDLGKQTEINAVQVNFSERNCKQYAFDGPGGAYQYLLEVSGNGVDWRLFADQCDNTEDKTHRYHEAHSPERARFVRLTVFHVPAGGTAAVSGLRVFGNDSSGAPEAPHCVMARRDGTDRTKVRIQWKNPENTIGVNVRWGLAPDRMHHTWLIMGETEELLLPSLDSRLNYCIAVEAFGRGGVSAVTEPIGI